MATYLVSVYDDSDFADAARGVEASSLQDAAEEYVRLNFANLDYPQEIDVFVKRKGVAAKPVKHLVTAIQQIKFRAAVSE